MIETHPQNDTKPASPYPSLMRRLFSMLYEALVLFGVLFVAVLIFMLVHHNPSAPEARPFFQVYIFFVLLWYFTWFWTHGGQTVAMRAWRFRVERTDGKPLRFPQACLRFILGWLSLISIVWALFDRDKQFLHDRLAGTRLVMV
jgi:uncharacterized RDD family membrane protein YckC